MSEFVSVLHVCLARFISDEIDFACQVMELFKQIDVNGDGRVQWDEFTRYTHCFCICSEKKQRLIHSMGFVLYSVIQFHCGSSSSTVFQDRGEHIEALH